MKRLSLVLCVGLAVSAATSARADAPPGESAILAAAAQMNSTTPQGVRKQTIKIGTFDAATKIFTFALEQEFQPGVPVYKQCPESGEMPPGCIHPWWVANVNSFDLTYQFDVKNAPANFKVTLSSLLDGTTIATGTPNSSGVVKIAFHPQSQSPQHVDLGGTPIEPIHPLLQSQLGSFVVPYQLLSIVYEPPGASSYASYDATSTFGSTVSWGFARTSGVVSTVNPNGYGDSLMNILTLAAGQGAGAGATAGATDKDVAKSLGLDAVGVGLAGGIAGAAATAAVQAYLSLGSEQVQDITTDTVTTGQTKSTTLTTTFSQGFSTVTNPEAHARYPYPGHGDVFVVMRDVLWAYLVSNGRVLLAPLAYSTVDHFNADQLRTAYPPGVAAKLLALDPMVTGAPLASGGTNTKPGVRVGPATAPRFVLQGDNYQCLPGSAQKYGVSQNQVQTIGVTQVTTETTVEKKTDYISSMSNAPSATWGYTQSTAAEQIAGSGNSASLWLECSPSEGGFWVDVHYDNLFRTFLSLKGAAISTNATVTGTVESASGAPAPGQQVTLKIGARTYVAISDRQGRFAFHIAALPKGQSTLTTGSTSIRVKLTGAPVQGLKLKLP